MKKPETLGDFYSCQTENPCRVNVISTCMVRASFLQVHHAGEGQARETVKITKRVMLEKHRICPQAAQYSTRMASLHHYFARQQVGDTQKRGKPEMRSSCRNSLDICTDRGDLGPAAGLQVSPISDTCQSLAILMNRRHCAKRFFFENRVHQHMLLHVDLAPSVKRSSSLFIWCGFASDVFPF